MIIRLGLEWVAWAGAVLVVWLLTLASVSGADLTVAGVAAAACGTAAVATRRALGLRLHPSRRYLRWLAPLPVGIAYDTAAVLSLPWRRLFRRGREGRWVRIPVAPGTGVRASTARAAATMAVSVTPGSFVVDDDPKTGELTVHLLVGRRSPGSMTKAVQK
jgi:multisubunit Na+/H+ antiporter MnhE subunit